jgi:hypothetical protein
MHLVVSWPWSADDAKKFQIFNNLNDVNWFSCSYGVKSRNYQQTVTDFLKRRLVEIPATNKHATRRLLQGNRNTPFFCCAASGKPEEKNDL